MADLVDTDTTRDSTPILENSTQAINDAPLLDATSIATTVADDRKSIKNFIKAAAERRTMEKNKLQISIGATATSALMSPKRKLSEGSAEKPIDLCDDESSGAPRCDTHPVKRARATDSQTATLPRELPGKTSERLTPPPCPPPTIVPNRTVFLSPPSPLTPTPSSTSHFTCAATPVASGAVAPEQTLPTPPTSKQLRALPELADRYLGKTSTAEGIEYANPMKFSLKTAFWKKWEGKKYVMLANYLRAHFDPVPFAKAAGLPVEEVKQVFSALVCNPLYFAEEAKKRGDEGMAEIFEMFKKYGTQSRPWGKPDAESGNKKILGELYCVSPGTVEVILSTGIKRSFMLVDLSESDEKYLNEILSKEDYLTLAGRRNNGGVTDGSRREQ